MCSVNKIKTDKKMLSILKNKKFTLIMRFFLEVTLYKADCKFILPFSILIMLVSALESILNNNFKFIYYFLLIIFNN